MSRFRISVYAICRNEEKFIRRWYESMKEADDITVLDTGSTDNSVSILSGLEKVNVHSRTITPWRFDTARNLSLSLVSDDTDYCVCTDIDEVFDKGWREKLERALEEQPDKVSYRYVWSRNEDNTENTVFNIEKIHRRHGFRWIHPVHEVLLSEEMRPLKTVFAKGLQLNHFPDSTKSRAQYLGLLELSVKENPADDRNVHYLGREYMYYSRYNEAIDTLKRHLSLKSAVWKDERCASMRYIARCLEATEKPDEAFLWHLRAISEAPYLREPWLDAAEFSYRLKHWHEVITFTERALGIKKRTETYISDARCWQSLPYDILSIAYYNTGCIRKAYESCKKALELSPDDERIRKNLDFFLSLPECTR